ncbi:MAG: SDR family oxidoreductase [Methylovirgula sp.]
MPLRIGWNAKQKRATRALDFTFSPRGANGSRALRTPEHRLVSIEDIGNLASFLVSDAAAAPTGNIEYIDAGNHILA